MNAGLNTLTLTTETGNLTIAGLLISGTTSLNSVTGAIAESTSGEILTGTLTGASASGTTLTASNLVGDLATFTNAGAGGVSLSDGETLTVIGAVNAGTGGLTFSTLGAGHNVAINKQISAGGTVTINSADAITEGSGGGIAANTLIGSSVSGTTLNSNIQIAKLGNFTNTNGGGIAITDSEGLAVTGTVNSGTDVVALTATSGNVTLSGLLEAGTVTLASTQGNVTESGAGAIDANLLNVSASTGIDLAGPNVIVTIGVDQTNSGPNIINP